MVLVHDTENNNMTSVTLSSLCLDRTKRRWTSYSSLDEISVAWRCEEGACRPSFISKWWYLMSESCVEAEGETLEVLSSSLFSLFSRAPLPPAHAGRPAGPQRAARSYLTLTTASPQTSSVTIPHRFLNLHNNEDGGEERRRWGVVWAAGEEKKKNWWWAQREWWSHRLVEKKSPT